MSLEILTNNNDNTDDSCQTINQTTDNLQDIESLKNKMSSLQSAVFSFENILREHETILSLYNRAADLNEKYMIEINEKTQYIKSLEQKLAQIKEERDSLQLATRLIAQDKLCQRQDTTSNISNSNSVSCQCGKRRSNTAPWQNIRKQNNKANRLNQAQPTRLDMPNRFECLNDEAEHNEVVEIVDHHLRTYSLVIASLIYYLAIV